MTEKIRDICPICHNECDIDIEDEGHFKDIKKTYKCNQCSVFILPISIDFLVGDINRYILYKTSPVYDDTYTRDKMIEVLREGIDKYGKRAKESHQVITFCCADEDKKNDNREGGYIYLMVDKKYHIQEIK